MLLTTQPVATTITDPRNDTKHSGDLHLEVIALEPADIQLGRLGMTLDKVRADAGGGPVVAYPPPNFHGTPAPIPETVLANLRRPTSFNSAGSSACRLQSDDVVRFHRRDRTENVAYMWNAYPPAENRCRERV